MHYLLPSGIYIYIYTDVTMLFSFALPRKTIYLIDSQLQENLILSHSVGVGDPLPPERVRALMALRINVHAKGCR